MPAASIEIVDAWHVAGLRGSGSHDVKVRDVFVPADHVASFGAPVINPSPLAQIPDGISARLQQSGCGVWNCASGDR